MIHRTAAVLLLAGALPLGAQQWRTVDVARQLRDTGTHDVRIRYGAGTLDVRPAEDRMLFAMHMRYDEDAVSPVHRYDAGQRRLSLGVGDGSMRLGRGAGKEAHGALRVALSREVPMHLDVGAGAAEARLDLGDMSVRTLRLETGASDSKLTFDRPNRVSMDRLEVRAGAANIELSGLANSRAREIQVTSGVGNVELSFDGAPTSDVEIAAEMALGRVEVTVPRDVGVRVELSRFLAGFDHFGLERRGNAYYSENWEQATRRVTMRVRTVFGGVTIRRSP